jgi:2-succinyl-5-enolpyruvyl-6-hydroxy-3-cyclohexene-1-carboxylate synthase
VSERKPGNLVSLSSARSLETPDPAVVQTAWARAFMTALHRAGVRRAVISPGSRSTPFTLAAEFAGLDTCTIIDERSAAFFALGCARVTGEAVALICTSGTAGAHYYPAVIEAAQSYVPLVIVTADRPPELHGCAAPQTIDQTRLFGHWARQFIDLGAADASHASLRALVRKAAQALHGALWPTPGPVHVNAPARKPLEPARARSAADQAVERRAERIARTVQPRVMAAGVRAEKGAVDALAQACAAATRGLLIAGPMAPRTPRNEARDLARAAEFLARATGFPLLVEAASQLRFAGPADGPGDNDVGAGAGDDVTNAANAANAANAGDTAGGGAGDDAALHRIDGFDMLLSVPSFRQASQADLIVQIGPPPTSRWWAEYMDENLDCVHCVIAEHGWNDPYGSADVLIMGDAVDTLERLATAVTALSGERAIASMWARRFVAGNELVWRCVDQALASTPEKGGMSEGQAMRAIAAALPRGALLALGNSLPIRTIDAYCPAGAAIVDVMSQRGANGIDGLISSAAGAAWAGSGIELGAARAVALILGDVSFVHDLGGLAAAARSRGPLCIVVMDNDGGRIFELLPIARAEYGTSKEIFEAHWLTRPRCDMQSAAAMFGITYARAHTSEELGSAVRAACVRAGCTIVHAAVEPMSAADDARRVRAAVDAGIAAVLAEDDRESA